MVSEEHIYHAPKTVLRQWLLQPPAPQGLNPVCVCDNQPLINAVLDLAGLVCGSLLNVSFPPPPPDSFLSQMSGASTPHPFLMFSISHDAFLFLEPKGFFPSLGLLRCLIQMRRLGDQFLKEW